MCAALGVANNPDASRVGAGQMIAEHVCTCARKPTRMRAARNTHPIEVEKGHPSYSFKIQIVDQDNQCF